MTMSCGRLNGPCLRRCSTMREARVGPTPGNRCNSSTEAVLTSMRPSFRGVEIDSAADGGARISARPKRKRATFVAQLRFMELVIWRIAVMEKRKTTQRDKETKGQREPEGGVFPFFVPLTLCPFVLKKLSSPTITLQLDRRFPSTRPRRADRARSIRRVSALGRSG